jgi:formate dehydrogenase subunit gamma
LREPFSPERALAIIAAHRHDDGAAMPILQAMQEVFGHVPQEAVPLIADALNLSRADVHGIVTFYHDFRRTPPGRHVLKLCRAEACQSMGGDKLAEHAQHHLGAGFGETSRDGAVTVEPVYCLGMCACAPAAMIDGKPVARLNRDKLDKLVETMR